MNLTFVLDYLEENFLELKRKCGVIKHSESEVKTD